jgi:copper chaperone CopZ
MKKTVIQLETVTCPSCIKRIEGTLCKQKGVLSAVVKFNASKVEVNHEDNILSDDLTKVIQQLGYHVIEVHQS